MFFLALFFLKINAIGFSTAPQTVPKDIAQKFGKIQIYYGDRICPLETFAQDFTVNLYGKTTYKSLSSNQVLCGWLFYHKNWKNEPIIKTKNEKIQLLFMFQTRALLKVFPINDQEKTVWHSPDSELIEHLSENERLLIRHYFDLLLDYATEKNWSAMSTTLEQLIVFQQKSGNCGLLSPQKMQAEHIYNKVNTAKTASYANLFIGIIALIYFSRKNWKNSNSSNLHFRVIHFLLSSYILASGLFILLLLCLRGYISGHIPLSNGFETMQFLACCILFLAFFFRRKSFLLLPFGCVFSGLVLFVSIMVGNTQITQLQPILLSPLLSIHVSLIMIAYTLFGFITFNSLVSFFYVFLKKIKKSQKTDEKILKLYIISWIFLYPAVFLLTSGIIVGSIWAEISWGRYWGWDAKETWALITLIIYALPLFYSTLLHHFDKPIFFHFYMLLASLSVLMTSFGVNYLLVGLHSYAG